MASLMRVAPELPVDDMAEALQHYEKQLGFQVAMTMPELNYAIVERDGVSLHLFTNDSQAHSPGSVHIFATDLDDLLAELQTRGAQLTQAIVRQPWGNRDFRAVDPSGNAIKFTEPLDENQ
jgi:predicted enzyme related to lactoylglutathione lyase